MIAIFNRSYYEEVLVVRVHPEFLENQWLPPSLRRQDLDAVWQARYDEINAFEEALTSKNVPHPQVLSERFQEGADGSDSWSGSTTPEKNWKFSAADVRERAVLGRVPSRPTKTCSTPRAPKSAPWYVIPADKKWFTRACVADIITSRIQELDLKYPTVSDKARAALADAKRELENEELGPVRLHDLPCRQIRHAPSRGSSRRCLGILAPSRQWLFDSRDSWPPRQADSHRRVK